MSVVLRHRRRFLLVCRARPPARGLYAFPGGRVEPGETAEAAALRELREETGLTARDPHFFRRMTLASDDEHTRFHLDIFRACHVGGRLEPGDDAESAGWYGLSQLQRLPLAAGILTVASDIDARCGDER